MPRLFQSKMSGSHPKSTVILLTKDSDLGPVKGNSAHGSDVSGTRDNATGPSNKSPHPSQDDSDEEEVEAKPVKNPHFQKDLGQPRISMRGLDGLGA
ncbi:hypothetical protein BASA61_000571 [Batrachochytrium salamandrivorans]|nr:hypothetical protein BASA61_000571 [Batrachochytrium salamandrivorans]